MHVYLVCFPVQVLLRRGERKCGQHGVHDLHHAHHLHRQHRAVRPHVVQDLRHRQEAQRYDSSIYVATLWSLGSKVRL